MTILIKGGHVINPATQMDEVADVLIKDQKIKKIGKELPEKEAERVINADGCYVMPGFIDMHVHFRDPGFEQKEDIYTGMQAAAHGGYTTVLTMPNTKPVADNPDIVNYVHNKAKSGSCIHVLQVGAVTKGQQGKELADIEGMVKAGSPAISEDGKSVMDAALYRDGMLEAARLGIPVLAHCEDIHMVRGGVMNADAKAKELGLPGITNSVEDVIVARDIILAKDTGAQLHLCHCSTKDSVLMVKVAKEEGVRVSAEVCPHHFTLSTDDMKEADTNYKMNPPLRTKEDVKALREGLRDGIMEVISTDHAPHTFEDKNRSMQEAPFGIVGLETAGKGKKAQAPAEIPGGTVSGSKEPLLPYSCRLSPLAYGMENGLRPALPGGSLSSPVCGSLTEARPSGISAGCAAVRGNRGKSGFDYGLRKGCDTA